MVAMAQENVREREDALSYLPHKGIVDYRRKQIIYDEQHPAEGLFLIVRGRVKVAAKIEDGSQAVIGIYHADDFFGEMALLGVHTKHRERATTIEAATLMSWSAAEIEAQIERHPKLGLALVQILVDRCLTLQQRLQGLALDKAPERVVDCLLEFARSGTREADGSVQIPPLTHETLSGYIGTSREIVTFHMNQLRRLGFLRYSRKGIQLFPEALREHMRRQGA
jgi:CRP-like cAMP-binding protein